MTTEVHVNSRGNRPTGPNELARHALAQMGKARAAMAAGDSKDAYGCLSGLGGGTMMLETEQLEDRRQFARRLLTACMEQGEEFLRKGYLQEAKYAYKTALEGLQIADLLLTFEEREGSIYSRSTRELEGVESFCEKLGEEIDLTVGDLIERIDSLILKGDILQAKALYDKAISISPSDPRLVAKSRLVEIKDERERRLSLVRELEEERKRFEEERKKRIRIIEAINAIWPPEDNSIWQELSRERGTVTSIRIGLKIGFLKEDVSELKDLMVRYPNNQFIKNLYGLAKELYPLWFEEENNS